MMSFTVRYLFIRSEVGFETENASLAPLCEDLDDPVSVLCLKNELTWRDGAVIRFYSNKSSSDISERLKDHLKAFEMWSIHDAYGDYHERFGGTLEKYYRDNSSTTSEHTQVFIRYVNEDVDRDEVLEKVSTEIKEKSWRAFYFKAGCILMLQPNQPLGVLTNRFQGRNLRRYIHSVAVTCGEETLSLPLAVSPWRKLRP